MHKVARWISLFTMVSVTALAAEPEQAEGGRTAADASPAVDTGELAPNVRSQPSDSPAVDTSAPASAPRQGGPIARSATDRLQLDTTVVTGNRELPKVLYIVPWKKADLGELPAQPFNTLLDEVLTPVDRDVFRREVTYFEAVSEGADATQSTSQVKQ